MKKRNCIVWMLVLLMVLALIPGVSFAEPPVGPCPGRDSGRNGGNHFWNQTGHADPTCTEAGYTTYQCVYCGQTYTDNIPALGHDWAHGNVIKAPTCTEMGTVQYVCRRDHTHTYQKNVQALGHDWTEWYMLKAPTLGKEGIEERKCQRCGLTEQRPIPPLGAKEQYSLSLVMVQTAPSGTTFDYETFMDEVSGGIVLVYDTTLINTGTEPLNIRDFVGGRGETAYISTVSLYPGESYSFPLPWAMNAEDIIPGSASETLFGATDYSFYFFGDSFDGEEHVCCSNTVSFEYRIKTPVGFDEWQIPSESAVTVEKIELSTSADPNGYQLGETIFYNLFVGNIGVQPLQGVTLYDRLNGGAEEALMTVDIAPGEGWPYVYQHTVTPEDVNQGFVANYAIARWTDPESGEAMEEGSQTVIVPVINRAGLMVTKAVEGGPANGKYYVPGETVHFKVTVYNNSDLTQKAIVVVDPLVGESKTCPDLLPGESVTLDFDYVVTEYDAIVGYVENYAFAMEVPDAISNIVRVDAGFDGPFGVITALEVIKVETSTPNDPKGYVLGETITYEITVTNTGETLIPEGIVSDSLKDGSGEIGSFENLYPTSSRTYTFSYVVTEKDIHSASKTVVNQAAVWYDLGGHGAVQTSNLVESPVWGEDPYGFEDEDDPPLPGDDYCVRILTGKGAASDAFTLHFCSTHLTLEAELEAMKAAAVTEEQRLSYFKTAQAAWQTGLDTLYEVAQAQVNSTTAAALMSQQMAFKAYMDSYEALLNRLYPNEPMVVAQELAEGYRNMCVDLCYELHKAPEARPDSILRTHEALHAVEPGHTCSRTEGVLNGADLPYSEILCTDHAAVDAKILVLANAAVNKDARAAAFQRGQRMWQSLMDSRTNARYKAADQDTRAIIAQNRKAFDKFLTARKALLTIFYPGQPDVVAEILARTIQDKEMDLCALWK